MNKGKNKMQSPIHDFKDPRGTPRCGKILTIWGHVGQREMKEKQTENQILLASKLLDLEIWQPAWG